MTQPAVLITGGATRIGAELARGFARSGWYVVIHYNSSSGPAEELARELGQAETVQCDLNDDEAAVEMIAKLAERLPDWRCLINSASVFNYDGATNLDPGTNREAMQINALAPARMSQAFLASAVSADLRSLIQVTDMKLANPNPDFFSYTMSKHALASTIKMLAKSTANDGHRVYGIGPGAILASHDQSEEETELSHRLNLLGRKTDASEIVDAALFLASGELRSGETLFIDSGQHLLDQDRDVIWLAREQAKSRKAPA
ncbi:SDR family oxidoreductase [Erythrobacter crassostreae]|uniref:SDR family oxidoreductase n=1 Tax=Erythrobacter crassostreae TaxID=2828328 RepID=A0A9X1F5C3_9SPHN|nr:SDR family oxidoreductase [Erythrobacter crassostrea]MBV7260384.1 SDR family oxidoreductase [Erythrobacter crassostrea]